MILQSYLAKQCLCHGRKSNLVEFQILLVESPIGVSTSIKSNLEDLGITLGSEIKSNIIDRYLGIALCTKI